MIIVIEFFIKYNMHNNFDFLCLKYQLDKFLLNLYIRHSLL